MKNWMMWVAAAVVLAVIVYLLSEQVQNRVDRGKEATAVRSGEPAPDFEGDFAVNGRPVKLSNLKGKVVLVDFWAVWCGPCIATFPHLREWNAQYKKDGLEIVGVTEPIDPNALKKFAEEHRAEHLLMTMSDEKFGRLSSAYGVTAIPRVFMVDRKGLIRESFLGGDEPTARKIEASIKKLLAEKA